jgi:hypothetical protein
MNKINFLEAKIAEIKTLANELWEFDNKTADAYGAMADVIDRRLGEVKVSEWKRPIDGIADICYLAGQINAMDFLHDRAVMTPHDAGSMAWDRRVANDALRKAWAELVAGFDAAPMPGQEDRVVPTTRAGEMGAMAPGAYD